MPTDLVFHPGPLGIQRKAPSAITACEIWTKKKHKLAVEIKKTLE